MISRYPIDLSIPACGFSRNHPSINIMFSTGCFAKIAEIKLNFCQSLQFSIVSIVHIAEEKTNTIENDGSINSPSVTEELLKFQAAGYFRHDILVLLSMIQSSSKSTSFSGC